MDAWLAGPVRALRVRSELLAAMILRVGSRVMSAEDDASLRAAASARGSNAPESSCRSSRGRPRSSPFSLINSTSTVWVRFGDLHLVRSVGRQAASTVKNGAPGGRPVGATIAGCRKESVQVGRVRQIGKLIEWLVTKRTQCVLSGPYRRPVSLGAVDNCCNCETVRYEKYHSYSGR